MKKKRFIEFHYLWVFTALSAVLCVVGCGKPLASTPRPIPVILDTDIGTDIDDMWALAFLLASPELDIKLIVSDHGHTVAKAHLLAAFLKTAGRSDIPIGIGIKEDGGIARQDEWLEDYPGKVYLDGTQAIIDTIMNAEREITLLAIGPVGNLEVALARQPRIVEYARLVVMGGRIDKQEEGKPGIPEYNVQENIKAAQKVYGAGWDVTMAPQDSARKVILEGEYYARVRDADTPMARMLMEHYHIWNRNHPHALRHIDRMSSVLWDTVAVYLAFDDALCQMRDIKLRVTEEGVTQPHPDGKLTRVAMGWRDLDAFFRLLSERIANYSSE